MPYAGAIYVATNRVNGKRYVGLTRKTVSERWAQHRYTANSCPKSYFHKALAKYGADSFDVTQFASVLDVRHLSLVERQVIQDIEPEYNLTNGGEHTVGKRVSPDVVAKIAKSNTGKKRTTEAVEKIRQRKLEWFAEHPEARAATTAVLAIARTKVDAQKRIAAVRATNTGHVLSDAHRAKMSATRKARGIKHAPEVLAKIAQKVRKPIYCVTNGKTYSCCKEAALDTGISPRTVWRICNMKGKSRQTFAFNYAQEIYHSY